MKQTPCRYCCHCGTPATVTDECCRTCGNSFLEPEDAGESSGGRALENGFVSAPASGFLGRNRYAFELVCEKCGATLVNIQPAGLCCPGCDRSAMRSSPENSPTPEFPNPLKDGPVHEDFPSVDYCKQCGNNLGTVNSTDRLCSLCRGFNEYHDSENVSNPYVEPGDGATSGSSHSVGEDQVEAQCRTPLHEIAVNCVTFPIFSSLAIFGFSIATCYRLVIENLGLMILCTIVAAIAHAIPIFAPFYWLFIIFLFVRKLSSFVSNWAAIKAGIVITLLSCFVTAIQIWGIIGMFSSGANIGGFCVGLVTFGLSYVTRIILEELLKGLYRQGYTSESALTIMGAIPIVIAGLLMPLLKAGAFFEHHTPHLEHAGHSEAVAMHAEVAGSRFVTVAEAETIVVGHADVVAAASVDGLAVHAASVGHMHSDALGTSHSAVVVNTHTGQSYLVNEQEIHVASHSEIFTVAETHDVIFAEHSVSVGSDTVVSVSIEELPGHVMPSEPINGGAHLPSSEPSAPLDSFWARVAVAVAISSSQSDDAAKPVVDGKSTSKTCSQCGTQADLNDTFCTSCGRQYRTECK